MKTLLVVDDEPVVRQLVSASLAGDEWQVLTAADGPSAIDAARNDHPDLILLDVSLPGLPGTEVLTRLRILAKPFTPAGLAHRVRETLDARVRL